MKKNVLNMNRRFLLTFLFPVFLCCAKVFAQSGFFLQDSLTLKLNNCNGKTDICFEQINPSVTQNLQIRVNNIPLAAPYNTCRTDTTFQYTVSNIDPVLGPYRIDSVTIGTKKYKNILFSNAQALTDTLNKLDPTAKWVYDDAIKRITGKPKLAYSAIVYTVVNSGLSNNTLGINANFVPKGLKLSFERGVQKVFASGGIPLERDSIIVIVECSKSYTLTRNYKVGETLKICADESSLPAKKVLGFKPLSALKNANVDYNYVSDFCLNAKGLKAGKDTFRFVLDGLNGISDTVAIFSTITGGGKIGKHEVTQFVKEGSSTQYCIDTDALLVATGDSITTITNYCAGSSGKDVKFTITGKNKCITIEGIKVGIDTACIVIENQKGQKDTTIIYAYVSKSCPNLVEKKEIITALADCESEGEICIPNLRTQDSLKYAFFVDGSIYKGQKTQCDFSDISGISYGVLFDDATGKLLPFPYSMDSWGVNGQSFSNGPLANSLQEIVDQLNKWNPQGNWKLDTVNLFFRGGDKANTYKTLDLTNQVLFTEHRLGFNYATISNGTAFYFKKGIHNIVILENQTGCLDTVQAILHCGKVNIVSTEIYINQNDTLCIDTKSLVGKDITITNNPKTGKNVTFTPSADKKCVYFKGNALGKDTVVLVACDEYKACDTTYLYVEVIPRSGNQIVYDTININGTGKLCLDTLFATDKIESIINLSTQSGTSVKFTIDGKTKCIDYVGTTVEGTDTAIVVICDAKGVCDTTTLYVIVTKKAINPTDDIVRDTVGIGVSNTYCLPKDKFDLPLTSPLSVKNICEKATNKDVTFTIQQTSECTGTNNFGYALIYTGVKIGVDTACIEVTDATGKKDTLRVLVTVIPRLKNVVRDTIAEKASDSFCIDLKKANIKGAIDTIYNDCPTRSGKDVKFTITKSATCASGYSVKYDGIKVGTDTACIVIKDKRGNVDTLPVYVTVKALIKQPKIVYDTVFSYQTKSYCVDVSQLKIAQPVDSVWNACPGTSNKDVAFEVDKVNGCTTANGTKGIKVIYTGDIRGIDTACYVFADDLGALDTVRFIVTVIPPKPSALTEIVELGKTITLCADTTQLSGTIASVKNFCKSNGNVKFTIDSLTNCVKIEGLKLGKDTACIVVCDEFDICDTTRMYITVVPVGSATISAVDDTASTLYPRPVIIKVLTNDKFDIKDTLNIEVRILPGKAPKHGVAIVNPQTKQIEYVPDPNTKYCGKDTFSYYIKIGVRTDTATVVVTIKCEDDKGPFKIYNAFSPNDDGKNDNFVITGLGNFPGSELIIYNRWGNQVFRMKDYDSSWDGKWEGKELPDGTYWYVLCLPDGSQTKIEAGYLELRR
jgi:gliding motility-associated-like protein